MQKVLTIFVIIVLSLVAGCGVEESTTNVRDSSSASTKTISKEDQTKNQINALIYKAIDKEQVAYLESVKRDDGKYAVGVIYYFEPSLLQEDYLQILSESTNVYKILFATVDDVDAVLVGVLQKYNDAYGQEQEKGLAVTMMTKETSQKINWDTFRSEDLDKVTDVKYYGDSIFVTLNELQSALNTIEAGYPAGMINPYVPGTYASTAPYPELAADYESVNTNYDVSSDKDNLALGKTVTGSVSNYNIGGLNQVYSRITDGNLDPDTYGESSKTGSQWIMVDLGSAMSISKIKLWNYYKDGRTYYGNKVKVSSDGKNWVTVFDSDVDGTYAETSAGKDISFEQQDVRYIRSWLDGSSVNSGNHWVEIAVYE